MGWENGRQLTSLSKQPPVVITTQPENYYGTVGGTATFTVAASGDRVTYQWQRSINDGETWDNISGGTSTTLSVPIQAGLNGYLYRCIAKDYMGHIATSQAGKLTVSSGLYLQSASLSRNLPSSMNRTITTVDQAIPQPSLSRQREKTSATTGCAVLLGPITSST